MLDKQNSPAAVPNTTHARIRQPWFAYLIFKIAVLLSLTACNGSHETNTNQPLPPPPAVKIAQPLPQTITAWDEYTGRVEAVNNVDIRARVGGYLEKVNFVAGEKVNKGDLLFLIDQKPYKAQLNFATAELERAKAKLELAKNDLKRAEGLFNEKAISTEEYDGRSKGLKEANAAVVSAEANVYTAKINLDYCEIRAPISGRIGREMLTAGNLVAGGDTTVLTNLVSLNPVYVYVDADEQSILRYKRQALKSGHAAKGLQGTQIELALADETGFPHHGQLDFVSPREDTHTGTVSLRGVFANQDEFLSPGFFARVRIKGSGEYTALLIPERAIATDQAQRFVWVVNQDNQVEYRKVELGDHAGQLRVLKAGVQLGEWVVVDGLQKLKPGLKVAPERINVLENSGAN